MQSVYKEEKEESWITPNLTKDTFLYISGFSIWFASPRCPSHAWNSILPLQNKCYSCYFYNFGDGKSIRTWLDPWVDHSPLLSKFGNRTITNLGGVLSHTLSESIIKASWALSANTLSTNKALDFMNQHIRHLSDSSDSIGWLSSSGHFSLKSCWNFLRTPGDDTPWSSLVQFKHR